MKTKKRFFFYFVLAILCFYNAYNFVTDVRFHNSNHAPSINGKNGEKFIEVNGYFIYTDSVSGLCYHVSSDCVQRNCDCAICRSKEDLLIKAATALNIIKWKKPSPKNGESFNSDYGVTMISN